jgi:hypothetical protein
MYYGYRQDDDIAMNATKECLTNLIRAREVPGSNL